MHSFRATVQAVVCTRLMDDLIRSVRQPAILAGRHACLRGIMERLSVFKGVFV